MKKFLSFILIALVLATSGCTPSFFNPKKEFSKSSTLEKIDHEDIYFRTPDNLKLHGMLLRTRLESRGTVIFFHGNDGNINTQARGVLWLLPEGFDVFIFDYRGYGDSEGIQSIEGVHVDAAAAVKTALSLPHVNRKNVTVLGQSLGGAIAVYTVANSPYKSDIDRLIIDSAFSDYRDIAREVASQRVLTWPLRFFTYLLNDDFSPGKWIKKVSPVPVIIIHGDKDSLVPVHHAYALYKKALEPKELWIAGGAEHAEAFNTPGVRKRLVETLEEPKFPRIASSSPAH